MKKRFYEEPEIEVMTFSLINTISDSQGGGLIVDDVIPGEGDGDGDGGDYDWGGIY